MAEELIADEAFQKICTWTRKEKEEKRDKGLKQNYGKRYNLNDL